MSRMVPILPCRDVDDVVPFYEALGYQQLGVMPNYTKRPDGTLWPGASYYRELESASKRYEAGSDPLEAT